MAKIVEKIEENPQVAQQVLIALLKTDARNAVEVELRKHKEFEPLFPASKVPGKLNNALLARFNRPSTAATTTAALPPDRPASKPFNRGATMLNRGNSKPAEFTFAVPKTNSSSTVEPVAVQSSVTKTVEDESEEPTAISESKTSSKHTVGEDEDVLVAAKEKDEEEKSEPVVQQEEEEEQVENNEPVVEPSPEHKMVAEVSVSPAPAPENTPVAKEESSVKEENAVKESSWVEPENDEVPVFRPQGNTPPQTPSITASPAPPADTPVKENSLRSKWSSRRISPQFAPAEKREPSGSPAPSSSSWSRIPSSSATPEVPVEHPEEMKKAFQCMARGQEKELMDAIEDVPMEEWSTWRNKGGFTLIELGESRDRRFAVHRLKVTLGLEQPAKEMVYSQLRVGHAVWHQTPKSVLPEQGTVREIRKNEESGQDEYLVSFWSIDREDAWLPRGRLDAMGRQAALE